MENINLKNFLLTFASIFWCESLLEVYSGDFSRILEHFFISFLITLIFALIGRWFKHQDSAISWMIIFYCVLSFYKIFTLRNGLHFSSVEAIVIYFKSLNIEQLVKVLSPVLLLFFFPLLFTLQLEIMPYEEMTVRSCSFVLGLCVLLNILL